MLAGKVLVTGASGSVGGKVLAALHSAEVPVRGVSRSPKTVARWKKAGIDAVVGSLDDLGTALQGCERMFLLSAATVDQYGDDRLAIDAARAAGLTHVVKLSSGDAVLNSPIDWARSHAYSDKYLKSSGLPFTLLNLQRSFPTCSLTPRRCAVGSFLMPAARALQAGSTSRTSLRARSQSWMRRSTWAPSTT